jgi:hypothetical protein
MPNEKGEPVPSEVTNMGEAVHADLEAPPQKAQQTPLRCRLTLVAANFGSQVGMTQGSRCSARPDAAEKMDRLRWSTGYYGAAQRDYGAGSEGRSRTRSARAPLSPQMKRGAAARAPSRSDLRPLPLRISEGVRLCLRTEAAAGAQWANMVHTQSGWCPVGHKIPRRKALPGALSRMCT